MARKRSADDDQGFEVVDDEPPPRRKRPAEDFEVVNDPPRRKKPPEDFEVVDDPPPRKKRPMIVDDDEEEEDRPQKKKKKKKAKSLGPFDATYRDTNIVALLLFGFCCSPLAFIHSGCALLSSRDATGKTNALMVFLLSIFAMGLKIFFKFVLPADK